jgi:hypothetical protein
MSAKYSVVMVSAGKSEWDHFTVPAWRSLGQSTLIDYELIRVDNGGENRGEVNIDEMVPYAEAVNKGAALATCKKLVILNNDITVRGDIFARLDSWDYPYGGAVGLIKEGVEYIEGWCIVIDRDVWNFLGGFDIAYKNSWEDVDLAWRLSRMGIKGRVIPLPILHVWGATRRRYPESNKWDEENRQRLLSRMREQEAKGG